MKQNNTEPNVASVMYHCFRICVCFFFLLSFPDLFFIHIAVALFSMQHSSHVIALFLKPASNKRNITYFTMRTCLATRQPTL